MTTLAPDTLPEAPRDLWKLTPATLAYHLSGGKWQPARHLDLLSLAIVDAVTGRYPRLIVSMPPRHGKSQLISRWTPVWFLEHFPEKFVMLAAYGSEYAETWGRRVRDEIRGNADRLTLRLSDTASASSQWETTRGGGMNTAGVGAGVTGKGADLLIIDDPIKDHQEADSETRRQSIWDWWVSTSSTRVEPGGAIIIVMTRWHHDDLVGRLLEQQRQQESYDGPLGPDGEPMGIDPEAEYHPWRVISLPALAEGDDPLGRAEGDALWPERWNRSVLLARKQASESRWWNALYQQRPTPEEGAIFKRQWFQVVDLVREQEAVATSRSPAEAAELVVPAR